ncbi:anaphase promoting complex subunit cdc16 [Homalodisca vitripennis]|nr:anaphase promoting complex subunit cdc16 [Homalodisca vitripennis]
MSGGDPRDWYWVAQCMYRSRQYHRAAILIRNKGLDKTQPLCQWLAGLCLLEAKQYNDALLILSNDEEVLGTNRSTTVVVATNFVIPPIGSDKILEGFTPKTKDISSITRIPPEKGTILKVGMKKSVVGLNN